MVAEFESRSWTNGWRALSRVRAPAIVLTLVLVFQSVGTVSAEEPVSEAYDGLVSRGPHEVLTIDRDGRIAPKPQHGAAQEEVARQFATTLENGRRNGFLTVSNDFEVELTDDGRAFVEQQVAELSKGCAEASAVSADWTGFHATVEQTCTDEEVERMFGVDLSAEPDMTVPDDRRTAPPDQRPVKPEGSGDRPVAAMGLGPIQDESRPDAQLNSEDWNCILSVLTAIGVILAAFLAVWVLTPFGWFVFGMTIGVAALGWFVALIDVVLNCTNLISLQVDKRVWVAQAPITLPIAAVGSSSITVGPDDEGQDAYYTYPRVSCWRTGYGNYRWSSIARQYVPTYTTWRCP